MNVGFAVGAEIADYFRDAYGDTGSVDVLGVNLTTYQLIIFIGFLLNIPDFIAIVVMREGAEMTENGLVVPTEKKEDAGLLQKLIDSRIDPSGHHEQGAHQHHHRHPRCGCSRLCPLLLQVHAWKVHVVPVGKYIWSFVAVGAFLAVTGVTYAVLSILGTFNAPFDRVMKSVRDATEGTIVQLKENFTERPFWIYMAMLGILTFVRLTFYIFHLMFPAYAIRVFGADFPVASILVRSTLS